MKVVAPSNPTDAYGLLRSAIEDDDPVLFIENIQLYFAPQDFTVEKIQLGKARVAREGGDLTIVTHSLMVQHSLSVAEQMAKDGVEVEVVDLRTISPWDRETVLSSVRKTGRALIVHEAVKQFGIGAEIASVINEELFGQLKAPVKRLGGAFCAVPYAKPLETAFAPTLETIGAAAAELIN